jgi:hypothetical protein
LVPIGADGRAARLTSELRQRLSQG